MESVNVCRHLMTDKSFNQADSHPFREKSNPRLALNGDNNLEGGTS
jgi:hypothetical protein